MQPIHEGITTSEFRVHTIHVNLVIMPLPASQHRASMIVVMDEWAFLLELFAGKFLMIISTVLPAGRQHVIEILSSIVGRHLDSHSGPYVEPAYLLFSLGGNAVKGT